MRQRNVEIFPNMLGYSLNELLIKNDLEYSSELPFYTISIVDKIIAHMWGMLIKSN